MAQNQQNLSFLPEDYVERRVEQRTNIICLSLFVIVLVGVVGAYLVTAQQRAEVREQRKQVNRAFAKAAERLEKLEKLRGQKQRMLRKARVTAALIQPVPRTLLLADMINRMPSTLSLFRFELDSKVISRPDPIRRTRSALDNAKESEDDRKRGAGPPPVPKREVSLVLIGVAPTDVQVARYMSSLARSKLLKDVNLVFSEEAEIESSTMRRFRIETKLNTNVNARKLDPPRGPDQIDGEPMRLRKASDALKLPPQKAGEAGSTKSETPATGDESGGGQPPESFTEAVQRALDGEQKGQ